MTTYILKKKDKDLLTFHLTISLTNDKRQFNHFEIVSFNEKDNNLLPFDLNLTKDNKTNSKEIEKWITSRKAPNNRALIEKLFESIVETNIMTYIDISFGLSLNDDYWIISTDKAKQFKWEDVNLYNNKFSEVVGNIVFTGHRSNKELLGITTSPEFTTNGMLKKCWHIEENGEIVLLKGATVEYANSGKEPFCEYYYAQVAKLFFNNLNCQNDKDNIKNNHLTYINYDLKEFHNQIVSSCLLFTSENVGYISMDKVLKRFKVDEYEDYVETIKRIYGENNYTDLMLFDALIGNIDRHLGNFGMLIDNDTNQLLKSAPIFDNGLGFLNQLTLEEIQSEDYIFTYNKTRKNALGQHFETVIEVFVHERHLNSLDKLSEFKLKRHPKFNLKEEWLKGFENIIRVNAKHFKTVLENKLKER